MLDEERWSLADIQIYMLETKAHGLSKESDLGIFSAGLFQKSSEWLEESAESRRAKAKDRNGRKHRGGQGEEASAKAEWQLWVGGKKYGHFKGLKVPTDEAENGFMNANK